MLVPYQLRSIHAIVNIAGDLAVDSLGGSLHNVCDITLRILGTVSCPHHHNN